MSIEADIRDGFITEVETLLPSVTVGRWAGEEAAFNEAREWPCVYVAAMFLGSDPSEEIGPGPVAYVIRPEVFLFVGAKDDATLGYGDDQCLTMLETLRRGLTNKTIASAGRAELFGGFSEGRSQALIEACQGQFLYGQSWRVNVIEESTT